MPPAAAELLAQISEPQEFLKGVWILLGVVAVVVIVVAVAMGIEHLRSPKEPRHAPPDPRRGFDVTPPPRDRPER